MARRLLCRTTGSGRSTHTKRSVDSRRVPRERPGRERTRALRRPAERHRADASRAGREDTSAGERGAADDERKVPGSAPSRKTNAFLHGTLGPGFAQDGCDDHAADEQPRDRRSQRCGAVGADSARPATNATVYSRGQYDWVKHDRTSTALLDEPTSEAGNATYASPGPTDLRRLNPLSGLDRSTVKSESSSPSETSTPP